jgi:hypothetical protein
MRMYMHEFACILVRICKYVQVYAIIRTLMLQLATFRTKNACIYLQYVHILATYVTIYVYIRTSKPKSTCI